MKITLDLPDELLAEAKLAALRRRTTLKALFTSALERELRGEEDASAPQRFQVDASGWPVLRRGESREMMVTDKWVQGLRKSEAI